MNRIVTIGILVFLCFFNLQAQKIHWGITLGSSINKTAVKTDATLEDDIYDQYNLFGSLGLNTGVHAKLNIANNLVLLSNAEYFRTQLACKDITFVNQAGEPVGDVHRKIINNSMQLNSTLGYELGDFVFGGGFYFNTLIRSTTITDHYDFYGNDGKKLEGTQIGSKDIYRNNYYSRFNFGVSFLAAYNFNRWAINLKYNHGLTDKIASKDNKAKEYDRAIILGLLFYFN